MQLTPQVPQENNPDKVTTLEVTPPGLKMLSVYFPNWGVCLLPTFPPLPLVWTSMKPNQ